MPTNLDRIQVLLRPEPYAQVRTLAKQDRRTLSAMAAELIQEAMKLPRYRQLLAEAEKEGGTIPAKEDPRDEIRQDRLTATKGERVGKTYGKMFDEMTEEQVEKLAKLSKLLEIL